MDVIEVGFTGEMVDDATHPFRTATWRVWSSSISKILTHLSLEQVASRLPYASSWASCYPEVRYWVLVIWEYALSCLRGQCQRRSRGTESARKGTAFSFYDASPSECEWGVPRKRLPFPWRMAMTRERRTTKEVCKKKFENPNKQSNNEKQKTS